MNHDAIINFFLTDPVGKLHREKILARVKEFGRSHFSLIKYFNNHLCMMPVYSGMTAKTAYARTRDALGELGLEKLFPSRSKRTASPALVQALEVLDPETAAILLDQARKVTALEKEYAAKRRALLGGGA